jgi:hypothetical protein
MNETASAEQKQAPRYERRPAMAHHRKVASAKDFDDILRRLELNPVIHRPFDPISLNILKYFRLQYVISSYGSGGRQKGGRRL